MKDIDATENMWADQEEATDLGSRKTGVVSGSKKAGHDVLRRSAEEEQVLRDDGSDVGAGEAVFFKSRHDLIYKTIFEIAWFCILGGFDGSFC